MNLKIQYIEPSELTDYSHNNKIHTEEQINKLVENFDQFGFDVPIVTDENFIFIKGHGRKYTAIKKGMEKVPVIVRDEEPSDMVDVDGDKEGRSYAIELSFAKKETAEDFLQALGMKDYKFKGFTKLVDEDDLDLSVLEEVG